MHLDVIAHILVMIEQDCNCNIQDQQLQSCLQDYDVIGNVVECKTDIEDSAMYTIEGNRSALRNFRGSPSAEP